MTKTTKNFKNIDLFKGLLILLVILGHVLQGSIEDKLWRTIIYSFHMPLFIGISGFLFNVKKMVTLNLIELIKKYLFRVILPWTIATIGYFLFMEIQDGNGKFIKDLIVSFILPFYHLWFIPSFLSWIVLTWILKKIGTGNKMLLSFSIIISLVTMLLNKYPETYQGFGILTRGIGVVLHTFRPYFYFFFVLGLVFRGLELKKPNLLEYAFPALCFGLVLFLFYYPNKELSFFNFFLFNSLLLYLVLKVSINNMVSSNKIIEWIGLNSLGIYLWHVIPILICKSKIGTENLALFYPVVIFSTLVFIAAYYYLLKINFIRKYVFGM